MECCAEYTNSVLGGHGKPLENEFSKRKNRIISAFGPGSEGEDRGALRFCACKIAKLDV